MSDRRPWDRRDDETESQWLAFMCYRDQDLPRTMPAAFDDYSQKKGLKSQTMTGAFKEWKQQNDWEERVTAYDRWKDRQTQAAIREAHKNVLESLSEHAKDLAKALIEISLGIQEPHSARVGAIKTALDKLGLSDSIEVELDAEVEHQTNLEDVLDELENKDTAELAQLYFREGEAES